MGKVKNWCFTSFNLDIDWENQNIGELDIKQNIKYIIYQGEHCQDGKKHIQGFLQLNDRKEMTFVKKLLKDKTLHLEPMRGTPKQAQIYCTEEYIDKDGKKKDIWFNKIEYGELDETISGTRTDLIALKDKLVQGERLDKILINSTDNKEIHNILQYNRTLKKLEQTIRYESTKTQLLKQFDNTKWNKIQTKILEIIAEKPDDREVNWIYDEDGNSGKSYLSKYLQLTEDLYYITGGKQNDILYGYEGQEIVIIDLARTYADNLEHIYTIIENLKNGMYLSTKYETIQKIFKVPHIIVMANFRPDKTKLSRDRWNIINTDDYQEDIPLSLPEPPLIPIKKYIKSVKKA
ncbi:MAG: putative viral replication protein [Cressdnaviricota sp.]|nr:MAG: putative viral replication protein [Cressdnaviricota sp.]